MMTKPANNMAGQRIAVWFSCGAASAMAALLTVALYGARNNVRIINSPVAEEDADNRRFLADVEALLNRHSRGPVEIETATNTRYPSCSAVDVWNARKFMSGPHGAPCTLELKKEARRQWEACNPVDWHVLGFSHDEKKRHERFTLTERANVLPVLINARLTKRDCIEELRSAGIRLPRAYDMGYPNANCIGCVKASSPTYWNHVRKVHPNVFKERAEQSRRIGARLVRVDGERIFLDELPPDAVGRSMQSYSAPDCGVFCEEDFAWAKE